MVRAMAMELGFCYLFAPCYLSLVKGSGVEYHVPGENELGLHGNAILSRYPIRHARAISLKNGIDKMRGREKRLGRQAAPMAEIDFPGYTVTVAAVHLDMQSSQRHRRHQMRQILAAVPEAGPVVLGGDWNTSTYDSSRALFSIVGFWRRVLMGVDYTIRNHYLHPERWFERRLFRLLESGGFDYRECNVMGEHTSYYDITDPRALGSLGEWVPGWCFHFIRWALRQHGGRCPFKLDWLATRDLCTDNPRVLHHYARLSDHDPVGIDIRCDDGLPAARASNERADV
jgi:endonuclease/exonuclease/phosphatase family metal-dependent hydrolase